MRRGRPLINGHKNIINKVTHLCLYIVERYRAYTRSTLYGFN